VDVPRLQGAALEGEAGFRTHCQRCYGENAAGSDGHGPPLVHPVYVPGHHSDAAFSTAATFGARSHHWSFGDMPAVEGLSDAETASIIA
jgi:cytochrome c2